MKVSCEAELCHRWADQRWNEVLIDEQSPLIDSISISSVRQTHRHRLNTNTHWPKYQPFNQPNTTIPQHTHTHTVLVGWQHAGRSHPHLKSNKTAVTPPATNCCTHTLKHTRSGVHLIRVMMLRLCRTPAFVRSQQHQSDSPCVCLNKAKS